MHPWEWTEMRKKQDELVETARQTVELKAKDRPALRRPKKGDANRGHGKSRRGR